MSWPEIELRDACEVLVDCRNKTAPYEDNGIPLIRTGNFRENSLDLKSVKYVSETTNEIWSSRHQTSPGDVVYCREAPFGMAAIVPEAFYPCLGQRIMVARPDKSRITSKFLWFALNSPQVYRQAERVAVGATVKHLRVRDVEALKIPLPPLPEQKRIAAILDKADEIRRKRAEAIKLTEELLRSAFLEMFGDPVTNPKGWEVKKLGEVFEVQLGKMLSQKAKQGKSPLPYLGNKHVQWGRVVVEDLPKMDFSDKEREKFELRPGDLLVCEGGEVGRTAIWHGERGVVFYQKALHRLRPRDATALPEYMLGYMREAADRSMFVEHTATTSIAHLTREKLLQLELMVPPRELQERYADFYQAHRERVESTQAVAGQVQELVAALTQRAFRGEL